MGTSSALHALRLRFFAQIHPEHIQMQLDDHRLEPSIIPARTQPGYPIALMSQIHDFSDPIKQGKYTAGFADSVHRKTRVTALAIVLLSCFGSGSSSENMVRTDLYSIQCMYLDHFV